MLLEALSQRNRTFQLESELNELSRSNTVFVGRQEMYDSNVEQIRNGISQTDSYLDPHLYASILEHAYKCNIIVFKRIGNETRLTLPRHKYAYYKNITTNDPFIFIYEHQGRTSDRAETPRCELNCP